VFDSVTSWVKAMLSLLMAGRTPSFFDKPNGNF